MLRLTLTMVPDGDEARARKLGEVEISNPGDDGAVASYEVRVTHDECEPQAAWLDQPVLHHRRSLGAWELARRALDPVARQTVTPTLREWAEDLLARLRGELQRRRVGMHAGMPRFPLSVALTLERELSSALGVKNAQEDGG